MMAAGRRRPVAAAGAGAPPARIVLSVVCLCLLGGLQAAAAGSVNWPTKITNGKRHDRAPTLLSAPAKAKDNAILNRAKRLLDSSSLTWTDMPLMSTYEHPCNQNYLRSLCDADSNIALGKPTAQSSTAGGNVSGNAVNNDIGLIKIYATDLNFPNGTYSLTETESNPWWLVDLQSSGATVCGVTIVVTMGKDCCGDLVRDLEVRVGPNALPGPSGFFDNPLCYFRKGGIGSRRYEVINCIETLRGRYLTIQTASTPGRLDFLQFQQVFVHTTRYSFTPKLHTSI